MIDLSNMKTTLTLNCSIIKHGNRIDLYILNYVTNQSINCNVDQKLPNCRWVCLKQCDAMKIKICTLHFWMDLFEHPWIEICFSCPNLMTLRLMGVWTFSIFLASPLASEPEVDKPEVAAPEIEAPGGGMISCSFLFPSLAAFFNALTLARLASILVFIRSASLSAHSGFKIIKFSSEIAETLSSFNILQAFFDKTFPLLQSNTNGKRPFISVVVKGHIHWALKLSL